MGNCIYFKNYLELHYTVIYPKSASSKNFDNFVLHFEELNKKTQTNFTFESFLNDLTVK